MVSGKSASFALFLLATQINALPAFYRHRREVPQEHSHEKILTSVRQTLNINNPDKFTDPVFGLLGNAAAANGLGNLKDPDCLQQAIADQAFTNAKSTNDIQGMTDALIYRALERNTGAVGQASVLCTSVKAVNPEVAAIQQHQDPASSNAAEINKGIALELAKQIASIGGDPQDALLSGTFAPGQIGDPTAAGNTCDDPNDAEGCIFTQNLLVPDATPEEIDAAVAGSGGLNNGNAGGNGNGGANNGNENDGNNTGNGSAETCPPPTTVTVTVAGPTATPTAPANNGGNNNTGGNNNGAGQNLQTFTGALGGLQAPTVLAGGKGFVVENNSDFLNLNAALGRSCDVQHNKCANAANSNSSIGFTVGDCDKQNKECRANIQ